MVFVQVNFREIPSHVLQKVCMYFTYKTRWAPSKGVGIEISHSRYTNSSTEIPEFPIPPEIALELLMAANFLDCWSVAGVFYISLGGSWGPSLVNEIRTVVSTFSTLSPSCRFGDFFNASSSSAKPLLWSCTTSIAYQIYRALFRET